MDSKRPSRDRWQFSLKSLLLLTLLVAGFFGAEIRMQVDRDRTREAAHSAEEAEVRARIVWEMWENAFLANDEAQAQLGFFQMKILEEQQAREWAEAALREANRAGAKSP